MFWHFLKVVYSRACESRGVWIKVRKLKFSYCLAEYMFSGVYYDVEVKRYLDPSDTRLLRALHSRNPVI